MSTTPRNTVRIPAELHAQLEKLAKGEGGTLLSVLRKAVERYVHERGERERFLEEVNAGYAALREDPKASAELDQERRLWEATLADGLEDEELWLVKESPSPRRRRARKRK